MSGATAQGGVGHAAKRQLTGEFVPPGSAFNRERGRAHTEVIEPPKRMAAVMTSLHPANALSPHLLRKL